MRYIFLLAIFAFIGLSCDRRTKFTEEGITFHFSKNLEIPSQKRLSENILFQIKNLGYTELKQISELQVDSIPFAYIFYIPFSDSITKETESTFKGFAGILSKYSLDGTQIHVLLTNRDYELRKSLPFDNKGIETLGDVIRTRRTHLYASKEVPPFQLGGLELVLLNKWPELYKTHDTLKVEVNKRERDIVIDITVDTEQINSDSLKSQFSMMDPLPWNALFDDRNIYLQILDKKTKSIQSTFAIKRR